MAGHKFKIGQLVYFKKPGKFGRSPLDLGPGPYQIIKRLPATQDGNFQYTVRSKLENHDRIAKERELTRA